MHTDVMSENKIMFVKRPTAHMKDTVDACVSLGVCVFVKIRVVSTEVEPRWSDNKLKKRIKM